MVDFSGWSMPIQYSSIVAEHRATRTAVGLFDISHMGRLYFSGPQAGKFLDSVVTRRVKNLKVGQIRYALVTNEQGGVLDDVLVYRLPDDAAESAWMMVVNGANRQKITAWFDQQRREFPDVHMTDRTTVTAMIAVQGPAATDLASKVLDTDVAALKYYTGQSIQFAEQPGYLSRTGYTGEDGCELIVPQGEAVTVWQALLQDQNSGAVPVGLGARDTLRLEAGMPLYGHELSESIDPYQAGLGFAVQVDGRDFIGRDSLAGLKQHEPAMSRVGLLLDGRRPAREGNRVMAAEREVGTVTSGSFSPTLERPIAMAYVQPACAPVGTSLDVDIRGHRTTAKVVELPFYVRSR